MIMLALLVLSVVTLTTATSCPPSKKSIGNSLRDANIPGLAAMVVNSTNILYEEAFGYYSPVITGRRRAIDTARTIFALASISKTFVAVAAMQLVQLAYLDLDKSINDYLPAQMSVVHPFYPNVAITMRHLLSHTSGIGPNFDEEMKHYVPGDDFTRTKLSDTVLSYTKSTSNWLNKPPGSTMHYSSTGIALAALIVEQIAAISFEQYVREEILRPLGITKTDAGYRLSDFEGRQRDLIEHYLFNASWLEQAQNLLPQLNITRVSNTSDWLYMPPYSFTDYPSGILRMSARSLAVYLQSFLDGFPGLLADASSIDEMLRVHSDPYPEVQMGLTWNWRVYRGRRFAGHLGAMPGITNLMMANEERTVGVILLSNGDITKSDDSATKLFETMVDLMIQLFHCFE